jgi:hypothetical protein
MYRQACHYTILRRADWPHLIDNPQLRSYVAGVSQSRVYLKLHSRNFLKLTPRCLVVFLGPECNVLEVEKYASGLRGCQRCILPQPRRSEHGTPTATEYVASSQLNTDGFSLSSANQSPGPLTLSQVAHSDSD